MVVDVADGARALAAQDAMEPVRFVPLVRNADAARGKAEQAARSIGELVE
jgi:hypothetical protein